MFIGKEKMAKVVRSKESIKTANEWRAKNTILINLRLNKDFDADIISKLDSVGNKQGYIKDLIRNDIGSSSVVRVSKKEIETKAIQELEAKYENIGYMALKKVYTEKHKEFLDGNDALYLELKAIKNVKSRKHFGRPKK